MSHPVNIPPVTTKFALGDEITEEQQAFLDHYGFVHFEGVATPAEVASILAEMDKIETRWRSERRRKVRGVPIFRGRGPEGYLRVQRFAFSSIFSDVIKSFVHDPRFEPIRRLIAEDARVGDQEKDGVVINRFFNVRGSVYPALGWHTDGLRDLFYGRLPDAMLNVGLHLDDIGPGDGGLCLIPGTHKQGFLSMLARKPSFIDHRPDPEEICVQTRAGDLTIHDGRLWHRVQRSSHRGARSIRRSMYVPYVTGPHEPKNDDAPTPGYHRWGRVLRTARLLAGTRPWDLPKILK